MVKIEETIHPSTEFALSLVVQNITNTVLETVIEAANKSANDQCKLSHVICDTY